MTPSYQAVQAGHSAIQFQHDHPEIAKQWYINSKYLIYCFIKLIVIYKSTNKSNISLNSAYNYI